MDITLAILHGLAVHVMGPILQSLAVALLVFLLTFLPCYASLYRGRVKRAFALSVVVLAADLGLLVSPPVGAILWLGALAYALMPERQPTVVYVERRDTYPAGATLPSPASRPVEGRPLNLLGWTIQRQSR